MPAGKLSPSSAHRVVHNPDIWHLVLAALRLGVRRSNQLDLDVHPVDKE